MLKRMQSIKGLNSDDIMTLLFGVDCLKMVTQLIRFVTREIAFSALKGRF